MSPSIIIDLCDIVVGGEATLTEANEVIAKVDRALLRGQTVKVNVSGIVVTQVVLHQLVNLLKKMWIHEELQQHLTLVAATTFEHKAIQARYQRELRGKE